MFTGQNFRSPRPGSDTPKAVRFTLLGVGAMNSPRYAPAGLLIECGKSRVMIDGGRRAIPKKRIDAWLVTDERGELMREIRRIARQKGVEPLVAPYVSKDLSIEPHAVVHTSHPAYGYLIQVFDQKIAWAPEFLAFPKWAKGADLMFAEAAGWNRRILFRGRAGGHAPVSEVSVAAMEHKVKRLVFAHIGRPTIRAIDAGLRPPFGEFGSDGEVFEVTRLGRTIGE